MSQPRSSPKPAPPRRKLRKSTHVRLLVLGTITLGACGEPQDPAANSRYVYGMYTDCVHDWGEQNCRDRSSQASSGYVHYYGPYYGSRVDLPSGESVNVGSRDQPGIRPGTGEKLGGRSLSVTRGSFGSFFRGLRIGG